MCICMCACAFVCGLSGYVGGVMLCGGECFHSICGVVKWWCCKWCVVMLMSFSCDVYAI